VFHFFVLLQYKTKMKSFGKSVQKLLHHIHDYVHVLNNSKIFAGIMIIILQICSRFVTIRLSKSMESYLKYTFSKQILIFAIAWMGTRDIYTSLVIAILFSFLMDGLCNEDSNYCLLPSQFREYHIQLANDRQDEDAPSTNNDNKSEEKQNGEKSSLVSSDEIAKAIKTLDDAKRQYTWKSTRESFYR